MTGSEDPGRQTIRQIARVRSPYREKFGVPRQPGLVTAAHGYLEMLPGYDMPEAFEGLEGFSHLWVIFGFDRCRGHWKPRVRPPRLGGNDELGVFATRSPFRPNNLGLSVLALHGVEHHGEGLRLAVSGLDLVDGTPVYDIKPYVPYADSLPQARGGFADAPPTAPLAVRFSDSAERQLLACDPGGALRRLIIQTLALDPRPAYRREDNADRVYGMHLDEYDVRWRLADGVALVIELAAAE